MSATLLRDQFRGMGSVVELELVGGSVGHLALARDRLAFLESCWSRFMPHSDISRLNAAQGQPMIVNPATILLLEAMSVGYTATDGAFDPTLLAPLVGLGYDASVYDPSARTPLPEGVQPRGFIRGLSVDVNNHIAQLPPGTAVDAGGIGKGLAADMVAEMLLDDGVVGALVSVGGDVRVVGDGPFDGGWMVGVDDAFRPDTVAIDVPVAAGGLASAGIRRRVWVTTDGTTVHELLDPSSRGPLVDRFDAPVHATVLAHSATWAEVMATLVMVRGSRNTFHRLDEQGVGARVVHGSGQAYTNSSWGTFSF